MANQEWPYRVGETIRRREIHERFGGQRQSGIVTPVATTDIFVFTDPEAGAAYGYDKFEGVREDGTYSYTGQGQEGNQVFKSGNKALRDAAANDQTIRLFRTSGVNATYIGEFTTAEPSYSVRRFPDKAGQERNGIVFNLLPIRTHMDSLPSYGGETSRVPIQVDWKEVSSSDIEFRHSVEAPGTQTKSISREEFKLQASFGRWLIHQNLQPKRLRLPVDKVIIEPDFYVPEPRNWIVEAKRSPARKYVREAIGQVLDYTHAAAIHGLNLQPVILLPDYPSPSLRDLLQKLRIVLIVLSENENFDVVDF